MANSDLFCTELDLIDDNALLQFTKWYLDNKVGAWFWEDGASSSGKYHPKFAQGHGGLVRHTRAVVMVCNELLRLNSYAYMSDDYKNYAIIACILHDTCKYGTADAKDMNCYKRHGAIAARAVRDAWLDYFGSPAPDLLLMAIRSHMGQWTEPREDRPFTNLDRLVHMADYIASRRFWDIPELHEDENSCEDYSTVTTAESDTLPF